jgi:hypothetical protein
MTLALCTSFGQSAYLGDERFDVPLGWAAVITLATKRSSDPLPS